MIALLAPALLSFAPGQEPARQALAVEGRLDRMVVIGASMAAGFGASRNLAEVFEASIRAPHKTVMGLGDVLFFTSPHAIGARQVEAALDLEPSLVVGVDFLFWFGYGTLDAQGGPIERESERLELLETGLALLERVRCPLVLGDFPDMSAAVGKMLAPEQMPDRTTLPLLSRRVREWAAARKDTLVLPLSEIVPLLASPQELRIGRHTFPAGSKLLLVDQLHASLKGIVAVAQGACDELVNHGFAREEDFEFELEKVMEKLGKGSAVPAGGSPKR